LLVAHHDQDRARRVSVMRVRPPSSRWPVEQLTKFDLVVNLKTAEALGREIRSICLSALTESSNSALPFLHLYTSSSND